MTPTPAGIQQVPEETLFEGYPAVIRGFGALLVVILTLGIGWLFLWWRSKGAHYRITTQRVIVERGVFSKELDQIDLYRINDYRVERPFGQRLLGTGNLIIEALDKTSPELRIEGLKTDVVALYERLRQATEAEKLRRGVRMIDVETASMALR
jgi:uncharacterized membrane protein YdbT with pleckstrin-like domain